MMGRLFVVSAPSGAGKTSLIQAVVHKVGAAYNLKRVITYTSRLPRPHEQDGQHYHFMSSDEFGKRIESGFFIEWSSAYKNYYGSPKTLVDQLTSGTSCIMALDREGSRQLKELISEVVLIWIWPSSIDSLRKRLLSRDTETKGELESRLARARQELMEEQDAPMYDYHIVNDEFPTAIKKVVKIVRNTLYSSLT